MIVFLIFILIILITVLTTYMILYYRSPHILGIHYKKPSLKVNQEMIRDVQLILDASQNKICAQVLRAMVTNIDDTFKNVVSIDCKVFYSLVLEMLDNMPPEIGNDIKLLIKKLFDDILHGLCSNGKLDVNLMKKALSDLYTSVCFQEW